MTTLPIGKAVRRNKISKPRTWGLGDPPGAGLGAVGFTLVELLLVAVFIAVIAGLSTPLFRRTFSDLEFKNTSFSIAKIINYAEEMAIVEKTNYKLNLNFEEGKYWLTRLERSGDTPSYNRITTRYGRTFSLPRGLAFSAPVNEIIFYPDGNSDAVDIKIINEETREARILCIRGFGSETEIIEEMESEK